MKKYLAIVLAVLMVMALCACGDKAEEAAPEEAAAPAVEAAPAAEAPAAEAPAEGGATGEMGEGSPEPKLNASSDFEITVDGVSGTAHYEDTDNGDQATKGFTITWQGAEITGAIDKGVWTADDAANQAVVDAVQAAFESNNAVGPASGEPSGEM